MLHFETAEGVDDCLMVSPMLYEDIVYRAKLQDFRETFTYKNITYCYPNITERDIINRCALVPHGIVCLRKFVSITIKNRSNLDITDCCRDNQIILPDFVYAIHIQNMNNVKKIEVIHTSSNVCFERVVTNETEFNVPLAIDGEADELIITGHRVMSAIPTYYKHYSMDDFVVVLHPIDDTRDAYCDVLLSIAYCDKNLRTYTNMPLEHYMSLTDFTPTYFFAGKRIPASAHSIKTIYVCDEKAPVKKRSWCYWLFR